MGFVAALAEALDLQITVVDRLRTEELTLPSRCHGWSNRNVLEHSIAVTRKFTVFAAGLTDEPHAPPDDLIGADHRAALLAASDESQAAWGSADMDRICRLRFGSFPADVAAGINLFDVLAHTWDIAATVDLTLADDDLWVVGLDAARRVIRPERDLEHYGPEVSLEATAGAMARFLAFLGRRHSE